MSGQVQSVSKRFQNRAATDAPTSGDAQSSTNPILRIVSILSHQQETLNSLNIKAKFVWCFREYVICSCLHRQLQLETAELRKQVDYYQ